MRSGRDLPRAITAFHLRYDATIRQSRGPAELEPSRLLERRTWRLEDLM